MLLLFLEEAEDEERLPSSLGTASGGCGAPKLRSSAGREEGIESDEATTAILEPKPLECTSAGPAGVCDHGSPKPTLSKVVLTSVSVDLAWFLFRGANAERCSIIS